VSAVGRTRTAPAPGVASAASLRRRLLQPLRNGPVHGVRPHGPRGLRPHLPPRRLHLRRRGVDKRVRKHAGPECTTLEGYRQRYAQYKTDPSLQAIHAVAPWLFTPDDHEFDNNCAGRSRRRRPSRPGIPEAPGGPPTSDVREHAAPPRGAPEGSGHASLPPHRLGESSPDFHVLDTRQYRTDQPCGDGNKPPSPEQLDPKGTLMGAEQRRVALRRPGPLRRRLERRRSAGDDGARRPQARRGDPLPHDQWPGYEFERRRVPSSSTSARSPTR
jgi:alkaline phosphatase D